MIDVCFYIQYYSAKHPVRCEAITPFPRGGRYRLSWRVRCLFLRKRIPFGIAGLLPVHVTFFRMRASPQSPSSRACAQLLREAPLIHACASFLLRPVKEGGRTSGERRRLAGGTKAVPQPVGRPPSFGVPFSAFPVSRCPSETAGGGARRREAEQGAGPPL